MPWAMVISNFAGDWSGMHGLAGNQKSLTPEQGGCDRDSLHMRGFNDEVEAGLPREARQIIS